MSRNSKNARLQKIESDLPKNRSAAAKARAASGEQRKPGRATAPKHNKKKAWWQLRTSNGALVGYSAWIKGGAKAARTRKSDSPEEVVEGAAG